MGPAEVEVQGNCLFASGATALHLDQRGVDAVRRTLDFRTRSEYHINMTTTALRTTTRRSSDLSKHSAEVFAEAEDHPVTVTRRDNRRLMGKDVEEAHRRGIVMSAKRAGGDQRDRTRADEVGQQAVTVACGQGGEVEIHASLSA